MKYLFLLLFVLLPFMLFSQNSFTITGIVTDSFGDAMPFANIVLNKNSKYAVSDKNGSFKVQDIQKGIYQIKTSTIGFQTDIRTIEVTENINLVIKLQEEVEDLNDIVIYTKSESKRQTEKAITISSLNMKQLQNLALGTEEVLKTTTGIVVRQSGGLGSNVQINLNGLTGGAVRVYYDGIPLEVYGGGIQINNIPVDALERVDIYKGVMPIDVGTDALGGGINLIPLQQSRAYLRTSYSVGSFNTHRVTFNGLKNINEKLAVSTISYFNYSDNNYRMRNIPNLTETVLSDGTIVANEERINTRRFHNQHISGFIEVKLRIKNLKWADRLEFGSSYSRREDEIQLGRFIINKAVGEAKREISAFAQRIDYRKTFFNDKLKVRYYGVLSFSLDNISDNTPNVYNWTGQILTQTNDGNSEIFTRPTLRKGENLGTAHRFTLGYKIADNVDFTLSDFYRYTKIEGEDSVGNRLSINNQIIDPNSIPSTLNQNIFGAELNTNFFEDALSAIAFFKNYDYKASSIDILQDGASVLPIREVQKNTNGYGFALKYQIHPSVFIRTSFEQAIRIPNEREVFGDFGAVLPNYELKTEESFNWNVGLQFEKWFNNDKLISVNINGFIRNQENLIRIKQVGPENAMYINEDLVEGKGIEVTSKIIPLNNLILTGNFTYQGSKIASNSNLSSGGSIGFQLPNIPQFFYNLGMNYKIENFLNSKNNLQFFWTYLFTDQFSINEVKNIDTANPDFIIPKQHVHNAGATYVLKQKNLAFSINLQNIFNTEIFDNFRIPRPGTNYAFKINYSL
tara:strand:+ start:249 stop:2639 length:2391 start_codon:yes stop_codon:yes gene_type:complete